MLQLLLLLFAIDPAAREVDLSQSWVSDAELRSVGRMAQLERLDLSQTKITDAGLAHLKGLKNVRELNLYYAEYITEDGLAFLKGWKRLEKLNLHGTRVTSKIFEHIAGCENLRDLDLGFTEITDEGFEHLAELGKLERLVIGGNRLTGEGLAFLQQVATLVDLDVSGIQRVDSGLWGLPLTDANLARIGALRQLRRLTIAGATIADRGVDRPGHPEAERAEMRDLSALRDLERLEYLDLSRQPVTAESVRSLGPMKGLRELRMGLCRKVDDSAVDAVLGMKALRRVYLMGSGVTEAGMGRLAGLTKLIP